MIQNNNGDFMEKILKKKRVGMEYNIAGFIIILFFAIILYRIFSMTVLRNTHYQNLLSSLTNVYMNTTSSPRGRIYDRNYKLLVDNKAVETIYYRKTKNISVKKEVNLAYQVSAFLSLPYEKITERNLKEFYYLIYKEEVDKKVSKNELNKVKTRELTTEDIFNLKIARITKQELNSMSTEDKKAAYLYYLMHQGYSYDNKIIKKEVTEKEYAFLAEHNDLYPGFYVDISWEREYLYGDTFKTILGKIGEIPKEKKQEYLKQGYDLVDIVGLSYLEEEYEKILRGTKAKYKIASDGTIKKIKEGTRGKDIVLSIDISLQQEAEKILNDEIIKTKKQLNTKYYDKSFVVVSNPNNGEVLAMAGRRAIGNQNTYKTVDFTSGVLTNPMTVGSVVKGASILVGYNEKAIHIGEYFYDSCIKVKATTKKCSWKNLGRINDIEALALSSNVYQFKTAMKVAGYKYSYNMPFQIDKSVFEKYRTMYHAFGLGVKTEIDLPIESLGYQGKDKQSGLILDYVMGQYETYTPIQLSQYISTLANKTTRYAPHLLKAVHKETSSHFIGSQLYEVKSKALNQIPSEKKYIDRVHKGFYAVMNASYGIGHNYIDKKYSPAGKTGTSQSFLDTNLDGIIDTATISTAFIGYAPSTNPTMSIVVTSPDISYEKGSYNYTANTTKRISKRVSDAYFNLNKTS